MSYLDRIKTCNRHRLDRFLRFRIDGQDVGWIKPATAEQLRRWPQVFRIDADSVLLSPSLRGTEARTAAVDSVLEQLHEDGFIRHRHDEMYPVTVDDNRDKPLMLINRAAAPYFGIRAFGQHLNGYLKGTDGLMMWIARRAASKWNFPNKLDNLVAGGLPFDLRPDENLRKECMEEAGIPPELANRARPVGIVSYCVETEVGLKPDIMYCYDLELPSDFAPASRDGEVEEFKLMPIAEVAALVRDGDAFKMNCDLVVIDFLVRHGLIGPDDPDYLAIVSNLRRGPVST